MNGLNPIIQALFSLTKNYQYIRYIMMNNHHHILIKQKKNIVSFLYKTLFIKFNFAMTD